MHARLPAFGEGGAGEGEGLQGGGGRPEGVWGHSSSSCRLGASPGSCPSLLRPSEVLVLQRVPAFLPLPHAQVALSFLALLFPPFSHRAKLR